MNKIIAVLALALATLANMTNAAETQWSNWGASPYASSLEEACKKAPVAIDGFNMPTEVKEHFKQVVDADCKSGKEVWLTPSMLLEQMWSGDAKPVIDKVTVGELPVLKSPDGRSYRTGTVAETAKAQSWSFVHDGKTYILYLPSVCFNWSWSSLANTPAPQTTVVPAVGGCSKGFYTMFAHVWSCKALPSELCKKAEKLIAEAEARDTKNATDASAYKPPDVSRSLYDDLIREPMAEVDLKVKVQSLNPQTLKVEDDLGDLSIIAGIGNIKLTEAQRAKIVETIWPDHFRSPTMSGGKRRIWLFDEEWRKPGGGNWCIKHVSGLMH